MAGIEQDHIRNARNTRLNDLLENEAKLSGENLKNVYSEIIDIFNTYEKSLTKQVELSSKLAEIEHKYKDDKVSLVTAEQNLLKEKNEQLEIAKYQLSYLDKESSQYDKVRQKIKHLEKETEVLSNIRDVAFNSLSKEQQLLININEQEKLRQNLTDKAIEKTQNRIKQLNALKKAGKLSKDEEKELTQRQKDLTRLKGNKPENADAFSKMFSGSFMKSVGGVVDAFRGLKQDEPLEDVIKRAINDSEVTAELETSNKDKKENADKYKELLKAIQSLGNALDQYVDNAASFLSNNLGQLNAALYGFGRNYDDISDAMSSLTGGALIQQTSYLQTVRTLAQQGIAQGGEVAALLTTVSEKTIPQFNATSGYMRRLVMLGEKEATQKYFGLESILQGSLNKQFGESSYLNQLFESVNSNLQDAIANLADAQKVSNSYAFTATVQEWLSALYEQGLDSSTINNISNVLNALGSGNISAMSSNNGMQKLALLAMDQAGQDYASILQNGLSADSVNTLLASMVQYLKDIATSTNNNNVLESAYANLFGISMTDMYALRNLDTSKFFSLGVDQSGTEALAETQKRLQMLGSTQYTTTAEQINNIVENLKFSFGSGVADDMGSYIAWKGGKLAVDLGGAVSDLGPQGKVIGKGAQIIGAAIMMGAGLGSAIDMVKGVKDTISSAVDPNSNSVLALYNQIANTTVSGGGFDDSSGFKALSKTTISKANESASKNYSVTAEDMQEEFEKEDPAVTILKEFEKTFMKNTEGNLAVAVSLQGMSNEVLKSFASIFADEDSMTDVFKSDAAKNKLFDYDGEDDKTTSASKTPVSNKNATTGSNNKSKK